jgi:Ca2+/H+ antiporter, TMEM165/GDT1 family
VLLAETGGKVQGLSAQFAARQSVVIVLVALALSTAISLGIAIVGAGYIARLIGERPRILLAGLALLMAGVPMLFRIKAIKPIAAKPGFGKMLFAFIASQIGDASQFIVFAWAARGSAPGLAFAGGVAGVLVAASLPILAGKDWPTPTRLALLRLVAAILLTIAGLAMALSALDLY